MIASVRTRFENRLTQLDESVLQLGAMAQQAVTDAMQALVEGDGELAQTVNAGDIKLNRLRFAIETECYALLVTEQPMARDMRMIVSALTGVSDLERIGDHGKRIARISLRLAEIPGPVPLADIPRLGELAISMLDRSLRAYAARDVEAARETCQADDAVDALYKQTFNVLLSYMLENHRLIGACTQLLRVAHELERVADRATNIGERVIFSVTGELTDLNV